MTDTSRPARAKLSVTRSADCISAPSRPQIETMGARTIAQAPVKMATGPTGTGDDQSHSIAAFLEPVRNQFNLADESIADLAAFTRKLLSGGLPNGGQPQLARSGRF